MIFDREKVIRIAEAEIGYHEKESFAELYDPTANSGDKNYVKYSRDLEPYAFYNSKKRGVSWCAIFVHWCFMKAYGGDAAKRMLYLTYGKEGAGCRYARDYYKRAHALYDTPEPGDQVFFWPADHKEGDTAVQHTGLVVSVNGGRFYTVEGNSNQQVQKHSYSTIYTRLAGFGRPNWSIGTDEDAGGEKPVAQEYRIANIPEGETVRMRKAPGTNSDTLTKIPGGEIVSVDEYGTEWAHVAYKGRNGYIMSKYLEPVSTGQNQAENGASDAVVISLPRDVAERLYRVLENALEDRG